MPQPHTLASEARGPSAGTLPWKTRREARLRPQHASLYPGICPGVWEPAAMLVDRIVAACLLRGSPLDITGRVLSEEHFEFRGGAEDATLRPRREDR